jgi:Family of unknown function (DUF6230)
MEEMQEKAGLGGTRWRRFAAVMVPTVLVVTALGATIANGAVPVSFAVSGSTFRVTADKLVGTNFVQYGSAVVEKNGTPHVVAVSGIQSADLTNMCQVVAVPGTPLSMVLKAGGGGTPAHADDLIISMTDLSGDATFTNINIGQDASTLGGPDGTGGQAGTFGQRADQVVITNLSQTAYATSAGTFTLPGLTLGFTTGAGCPA